MGNVGGQSSKTPYIEVPTRPFDRQPHSSRRWRGQLRRRNYEVHSTLLQLIAHRDWQRVLIRATSFPSEISRKQRIQWYGDTWVVLPIHLACALQPPREVMDKLLYFYNDTASVYMVRRPVKNKQLRTSKYKQAKVPNTNDDTSDQFPANESMTDDPSATFKSTLREEEPAETFSLSTEGSTNHKDIQPSDTLAALPVAHGPPAMNWDVISLLRETNQFYPLHIACLYRADPDVLQALVQAFPDGAKASTASWGMLPIHICAAGVSLTPPILIKAAFIPNCEEEWDLVASLKVLANAYPECLVTESVTNGMTPKDYIDETMEEGSYKRMCLDVLDVFDDDISGTHSITGTPTGKSLISKASRSTYSDMTSFVPFEIYCRLDPHLTLMRMMGEREWQVETPLYTLLKAEDWEGASFDLALEPKQARLWQYGIELDNHNELQLWKQLPIHHACRFGAPVEIIDLLYDGHPQGISSRDPYCGAIALHHACRYQASQSVVEKLIRHYPDGSKVKDHSGCLPLHLACMHTASMGVIHLLVKAYPGSVCERDDNGLTPLDYAEKEMSLDPPMVAMLTRLFAFMNRVKTKRESIVVDDDCDDDELYIFEDSQHGLLSDPEVEDLINEQLALSLAK